MSETSFARLGFSQLGGDVVDISTAKHKTADFVVSFENCKILVEEKSKCDDRQYLDERASVLDSGELHSFSAPLVRTGSLSSITRNAGGQIKASAAIPHDFRLIWFTATGNRAEAIYNQFIATLYGTKAIIDLDSPRAKKCYFFTNSDFHRDSALIDGAVASHVSDEKLSFKLCLNPLSPNYGALKLSSVVSAFGEAVEDPFANEASGISFLLDSDIDRNDEPSLLSYLQEKYSTGPLQAMAMAYLGATKRLQQE